MPAYNNEYIAALQARVREANRTVYDTMDLEEYNKNPSLYEEGRQTVLYRTLLFLRKITHGERLLDFGCGTGNVLRLARGVFPYTVGCDIGHGILRQLKASGQTFRLVVGDALCAPFRPASFDVITFNGVLHHIVNPAPALQQAVGLLRPGGVIYTDHDVNRYFGRFYHFLRNIRPRKHGGFGNETVALAEYHNTHTAGLDPFHLARVLEESGCTRVRLSFRHTTNPRLPVAQKLSLVFLKMLASITNAPSFYTHFSLIAKA